MILLDTHAVIWWASGQDSHLSQAVQQIIKDEQQSGGCIAISSISAWEIAQLVRRNRITLSLDVSTWLATLGQVANVRFIPLDNAIAIESESLPGEFHRDPADRMIVATARRLGVSLVTMDEKIRSYSHVRTIW